jgi:hypothetical protein
MCEAHRADHGMHPHGIDVLDRAQVDDYLDPWSQRVPYVVAQGHRTGPIEVAHRFAHNAGLWTYSSVNHWIPIHKSGLGITLAHPPVAGTQENPWFVMGTTPVTGGHGSWFTCTAQEVTRLQQRLFGRCYLDVKWRCPATRPAARNDGSGARQSSVRHRYVTVLSNKSEPLNVE